MKKFTPLLLLILFCFSNKATKAQAYIYHPFSTDTVKWIYYGINEHNEGCYTSYVQAGDTSFINFPGKIYKKIYEGESLYGYIREENKVIYSLSFFLDTEYQLYNFTKNNIGDTLKFYNFSTDVGIEHKAKITTFDSIKTVNGLDYYKVYKLQPINYEWGESCSYVERNYLGEAIGCFPDLRYRCLGNFGCPCENNTFFNTLIINKDTIIKNLFFDCKLTGINERESTVEKNIHVFPNPADDVLKIDACAQVQGEEKIYLLYDLLGNKLIEKKDNNCIAELSTKQLKSGYYLWHIITNKKSYTGKVYIKHN